MKRRHLLCCGAALGAGLFSALVAGERPLANPCLVEPPQRLRENALVQAAFEGLDPAELWDGHAHLLGTGDAGSGCTVHASMHAWWRPVEVVRRHAILNAACVAADAVSIDLFARLMDEPAHAALLHADVSAVLQSNRSPAVARTLLRRADWHARLLHGSDHPLPGVMPLFRPDRLAAEGLLDARLVPALDALRARNALLFDLALKRHVRDGGARLQPVVFSTRRFWQRPHNPPATERGTA